MRITFILNSIGLSGGTKVVFEYANRLCQRGHEVFIVYPLIPILSELKWYNLVRLFNKLKGFIGNLIHGNKVSWFDLKAELVRVPTLSERYIPDSDIIVATWWSTAYTVAGYDDNKGEKFYLVQHYEIWGGPKEKVDLSYKLGLKIVCVSGWLKNIIENELGGDVEAVISNAPGWEQFYPESREETTVLRILTPYRVEKWKGFSDAVSAFAMAKRKYHNLKLVAFGPRSKGNVPSDVEYHQSPVGENLRRIYNSCDIFLFTSHCEGFGLPPMEAMACKAALVTTDVGAVNEYVIPGETALVSKAGDVESLSRNILRLAEAKSERRRIAENGYSHIRQFTWENSCDKLENLFGNSLVSHKLNSICRERITKSKGN